MEPEFTRVSTAINDVCEYYEIKAIKLHLQKYDKSERCYSTPHLTELYASYTFQCLERMEDEIKQIILTNTQETKVLFFEKIKLWLTDWRIVRVNKSLLLTEIDKYNDTAYVDFLTDVNKKIVEFQSTPHYHLNHLEDYEVQRRVPRWFTKMDSDFFYKEKEKNYKYYCVLGRAEYLDTDFLDVYSDLIDSIITRFKAIITKYVSLYDAGKIVPSGQITSILPLLENKEDQKALPSPHHKIQMDLTVAQLTYLFKLMQESYLINKATNLELFRLIAKNFSTKEADIISTNSLRKKFYPDETEDELIKVKAFWIDKFNKWVEKSKK